MLFAFVGFEAHTNELAGDVDKFFLREQTVLRLGVTGSEYSRDSRARRSGRHEEDGTVGPLCFRKGRIPGCVPHHTGVTHRLRAGGNVGRTRPLSQGRSGEQDETEKKEDVFHAGKCNTGESVEF